MSVKLGLRVIPDHIEEKVWIDFYDEAVMLLRQFAYGIRIDRRQTGEHQLLAAHHRLESDDYLGRHFHICGDSRSGGRGESFKLYRDLNVYKRLRRPACDGMPCRHIYLREEGSVEVFCAETRGHPYHRVIWAIAALAEHRFPGRAMIKGNVSFKDWQGHLQWANHYLPEKMLPPLCMDVARLWALYELYYAGIELLSKVDRTLMSGRVRLFEHLLKKAPEQIVSYVYYCLRYGDGFLSMGTYGVEKLIEDYLLGIHDLGMLLRDLCLDERGPRYEWESVLNCVCEAGFFHGGGGEAAEVLEGVYGWTRQEGIGIVADVMNMSRDEVDERFPDAGNGGRSAVIRAFIEKMGWMSCHDNLAEDELAGLLNKLKAQYEAGEFSSLLEAWVEPGKEADADELRNVFFRICEGKRIILRETGWEKLERERSADRFGLLIAIVHTEERELHWRRSIRDAVIELCVDETA